MAYRNTLQADALKLVAKKLQSSLAVEGELPEDGLAAYGDDGDDLMLALARKLVNGADDDDAADTVEAVFAQARTAETESESYLVDDEWQVTEPIAPVIVEIQPTEEAKRSLRVATSAEPTTDEPQRALFSWAEFMTETAHKKKSRSHKLQPSISLFEWAVAMENGHSEEKVAVPA